MNNRERHGQCPKITDDTSLCDELNTTMPNHAKIPDAIIEPCDPVGGGKNGPNSETAVPRTKVGTQRWSHEPDLQRIELERENLELRLARDEAESVGKKYKDLYDFSPVGHFTLSLDGCIRMANFEGAAMVGIERPRLIGRSFGTQVSASMRDEFANVLNQVLKDGGGLSMELKLMSRGLPSKAVTLDLRLTTDRGGCGGAEVDIVARRSNPRGIAARRHAEYALRRSEGLFFALIEQVPVGVFVVDAKLRLRQANPLALKFFNGVHPLIGKDFSRIIRLVWTKRNADRAIASFLQTFETGEPFQSTSIAKRRLENRAREVFEWQVQRVVLPGGELTLVCFFNNITKRIDAESAQRRIDVMTTSNINLRKEIIHRLAVEEKLRETEHVQGCLLEHSLLQQDELRGMSHKILHAQEDERKRISRELHDVIAQTLVGINVHVAALATEACAELGSLQQRIEHTHQMVEKSVEIVHRFARELRPTVLDDLGLIPALQAFLEGFMKTTGIRVTLKVSAGIEESPENVRTTFYRIIQEALMNVAKHAGASKVGISIRRLATRTSLEISDDGRGFDVNEVIHLNRCKRLGLLGMRERAEMVDGVFCIKSVPGRATTIRVTIKAGSRTTKGGPKRSTEIPST